MATFVIGSENELFRLKHHSIFCQMTRVATTVDSATAPGDTGSCAADGSGGPPDGLAGVC